MKLYENGVEIGAIAQDGPVQDSDSVLAIGRWNGNNGTYYADILIDEVVVLNVTLDESDIRTLVNQGFEAVLAVEHSDKLTVTWGIVKSGR